MAPPETAHKSMKSEITTDAAKAGQTTGSPAVDLPRLVSDYFEDDGAPKKCPKCDSTKITEKIIGVVDVFQGIGPTCEAEYYCECGECVGFWAYGSWHPQDRESFIANAERTCADE